MITLFCSLLAALLSAGTALTLSSATDGEAAVELVQMLAGTELSDKMSNGNTLPQVKRPWGFNDWAPHTSGKLMDNAWWFHTSDSTFKGFKCSHQPSPWLGDWGYFSIMPDFVRDTSSSAEDFWNEGRRKQQDSYSLHYSPHESTWKPYLFSAALGKDSQAEPSERIKFEFTPTDHAGAARVTFPAGSNEPGTIVVKVPQGLGMEMNRMPNFIWSGYTSTAAKDAVPNNFKLYLVMNFSEEPTRLEEEQCFPSPCSVVRLHFGNNVKKVEIGVATSLISLEQAVVNLNREIGDKSFESVVGEGRQVWSEAMGRVSVQMADDTQHKVFYTNLWKAMLFPRFLQETDKHGNEVHYSPFNGKVGDGKMVVDSGFWDAYHTVYPLNSIAFPEKLGHLMDGWLNAFDENGWIPQWASPGNRDSMVGTMSDVSIADAIVKSEAGNFSFNIGKAYRAITKDVFNSPDAGSDARSGGRKDLDEYDRKGYVAEDCGSWRQAANQRKRLAEVATKRFAGGSNSSDRFVYDGMLHKVDSPSYPVNPGNMQLAQRTGGTASWGCATETVARTLNNAVADAAVARAATKLGHKRTPEKISRRSKRAAMALFNTKSNFFEPKDSSGEFLSGFEPLAWRRGFTEGSAYHYRFYMPHDVELLQELFGGKQQLCSAIKEDLEHTSRPAFYNGGYGYDIHEMKEHEAVQKDFGMYNHCNQPSHEMLWVAKKAGCDELADKYLRRVMDKLYTTQGWCGDEDNGEMGAWYVLSALGIYSLEGAKDEMVLGSPAVSYASVRLPGHRGHLTVLAKNQGRNNVYVQSVTWTPTSGSPEAVVGNVIKYSALMGGGTLEFTMGGSPRVGAAAQHLRGAS